GELLYTERRNLKRILSGLLWVASVCVLAPLGMALIAVFFYAEGTAVTTVAALLVSVALPVWCGGILWRYLSARDGDARQG
ncbi:MAG: hypothetical protein M3N18_13675, partial [Actinomycetota bacterium]|nr:hypothetical protein [Actinomycetota bacterium]